MEDSVSVEYGADLHTNDFGSGFPSRNAKNSLPTDMEYYDHPWNLNNLPILDGSVFKHINANISGMIIPWMYAEKINLIDVKYNSFFILGMLECAFQHSVGIMRIIGPILSIIFTGEKQKHGMGFLENMPTLLNVQ